MGIDYIVFNSFYAMNQIDSAGMEHLKLIRPDSYMYVAIIKCRLWHGHYINKSHENAKINNELILLTSVNRVAKAECNFIPKCNRALMFSNA